MCDRLVGREGALGWLFVKRVKLGIGLRVES